MADETPSLDLANLIYQVKRALSIAPDIPVVEYARIKDFRSFPTIGYEITGIEPNPEDGGRGNTGQFSAIVTISAYCFHSRLPKMEIKGKLHAAMLAAEIIAVIHQTKFGDQVGEAEQIHAFPDVWEPDPKTVDVWRVDWQHQCYLGRSKIEEAGDVGGGSGTGTGGISPVRRYFLGIAPDIGSGHSDDYAEIEAPPRTGEIP